jgi:F420-dependent oxidoreductase-like protein
MRIGYYVSDRGLTVDEIVDRANAARSAGLSSAWTSDIGSWDALTALAALGRVVPDIALATGVVVSHSRPPMTMAAQALTVQSATGNRLTLGIGVSHRHVVEPQFGASFDRPARHLREYLTALRESFRGESVFAPGARAPSVLVGALGPAMLRVTGELADGTVTVWAGPRALGEHIVPTISRAAAGRAAPRVVTASLVTVTDDEDAARAAVDKQYGKGSDIPHYRAVLDRDGVASMGEATIAGDEASVERQIRSRFDAGATEFLALPYGSAEEKERTLRVLAELAG